MKEKRLKLLVRILSSLLLVLSLPLFAINLELNPDPFILETRQICIEGHPFAFNPSIVEWNGRFLMSFREIAGCEIDPRLACAGPSHIGLVFLDDQFEPFGEVQMLDLLEGDSQIVPRAEDARLILASGRLFLLYSDNKNSVVTEGGFRMYSVELLDRGDHFELGDHFCFSEFEGAAPNRREKNWVPFDYRGLLLLAYNMNPHRILLPLFTGPVCDTVSETSRDLHWNFGEPRGGTPALLDGDHYLAFFHSSKEMSTLHSSGKTALHYFMGAYTFENEPPFAITQISSAPLIAKGFYEGPYYEPYWKPVKVVFPCGYLMCDHTIWLVYGKDDHELWLAKIDKDALLKSLVPVGS